ncbi:MAG: Flp pilus assembly protein CpaB [Methylocystaceae bacterium]|nr:Flp pilus assembly protein CpaB [Methylocystaceae bacterium]
MKIARLAILGIAIVSGGAAAVLVGSMQSAPPDAPPAQQIVAAPAIELDEVLVATNDIPLGKQVGPEDFTWKEWPKGSLGSYAIKKADDAAVVDALKGSVARGAFLPGEPIRRDKLIKSGSSGYLSAILPSGARAVAINIDSSGGTSAGGFILPNDRVDVILTIKKDNGQNPQMSQDMMVSTTLLHNIRVLAIGQNVQEKDGQMVVIGSNATLELDPMQAETIVTAQKNGQLSLALRSMLDFASTGQETAPVAPKVDNELSIIRFGVQSNGR